MDNRINEIRSKIKALGVSMFEVEANMRDQINNDHRRAWKSQARF